ncbi:MAG TPA: hypothetical protein VLH80_02515, partial [Nitrospiraceae bacterium]|nr:hypothetical protein [Nitrospiraceae bacterium]
IPPPITLPFVEKIVSTLVRHKRGLICTPFDDAQGQGYTFLARGSYSRLLGAGIAINDGGGGQGS